MRNIRTLENLTKDFDIKIIKRKLGKDEFDKILGYRVYDITGYDYWRFPEIAEAYMTKDSYSIQDSLVGIILTLLF